MSNINQNEFNMVDWFKELRVKGVLDEIIEESVNEIIAEEHENQNKIIQAYKEYLRAGRIKD